MFENSTKIIRDKSRKITSNGISHILYLQVKYIFYLIHAVITFIVGIYVLFLFFRLNPNFIFPRPGLEL